jgi:hypothetical protein
MGSTPLRRCYGVGGGDHPARGWSYFFFNSNGGSFFFTAAFLSVT